MDPLETWRPPAQGKPNRLYRIFSTLSSLRTGFSPQPTVRSWRLVDLICVLSSSRRMRFAQMRLQQGTPWSPTPWGQMAHRHQTRNSWDGLSGHPAWVYILGEEEEMPSKGPAAQEFEARLRTARAASLGIRVSVAAIAIVGASIASAGAQDWPTRPIRLVVGASAGGGTHISARLIAPPLADTPAQP